MVVMMRVRTATVEADIATLKHAADRAGTALACLFSSSAEFEADIIRERRAQGVYGRPAQGRNLLRLGFLTALLALVFLMI
jgi:DNA invertase Pin-like site-specific DNA recombinase